MSLQLCLSCDDCPFNIYYCASGIYWYIQSKKEQFDCTIILYSDTYTITNKNTVTSKILPLNIENKVQISKIVIRTIDRSYTVENFCVVCNVHKKSKLIACIVCGCFDGLTLNHNRLIKYALRLGPTIFFVDIGDTTDTKHNSLNKFMNSTQERIDAVKICASHHSLDKKCNGHYPMVWPRSQSMTKCINKAFKYFKKEGFKNIYYVCGSDQMEYIRTKLPEGVIAFGIERVPTGIHNIKKPIFNKLFRELDICCITNYPKSYTSWFSSSTVRRSRELKRNMDILGIDTNNNSDTSNPFNKQTITSKYDEFVQSGFNEDIVDVRMRIDVMGDPIKINCKMLSMLNESRIVICLPGRSSKLSLSSICGEFTIGSDAIRVSGQIVRFFTVDYNDRSTESNVWIDNMIVNDGTYYNDNACKIMIAMIAPRFSSSLFRSNKKFYGKRIAFDKAREQLSKLTILARSLGTAMSHMISSAAASAMQSIGYTDNEIEELLELTLNINYVNLNTSSLLGILTYLQKQN